MKIRSVGAELFLAGGRTDMAKLIVALPTFWTRIKRDKTHLPLSTRPSNFPPPITMAEEFARQDNSLSMFNLQALSCCSVPSSSQLSHLIVCPITTRSDNNSFFVIVYLKICIPPPQKKKMFFLRCDIPVVHKLQCRNKCEQQSWTQLKV